MREIPVLGPIWALLLSRKFWVAVMTLLVNLLLKNFPELAMVEPYGGLVVMVIGALLILAIAAEDVAASFNGSNTVAKSKR